jgi:ankyrin repeat protein
MYRASVPLLSVLGAAALGSLACFPQPQNPLSQAAASGDVATLERLIAEGGDPNLGAKSHGFTPLIWAARAGQVGAIRALVAHGADLNATGGGNDWVPLHHALHKAQTAAALTLLDLGADLSGAVGQRALAMAAGYGNAAATEALLDRGVDPHADFGGGPSLLALAAAGSYDIDYHWSGCEPHTQTVRAIVSRAPDVTLGDTTWDRAARLYVQRRGCGELIAMLR